MVYVTEEIILKNDKKDKKRCLQFGVRLYTAIICLFREIRRSTFRLCKKSIHVHTFVILSQTIPVQQQDV